MYDRCLLLSFSLKSFYVEISSGVARGGGDGGTFRGAEKWRLYLKIWKVF